MTDRLIRRFQREGTFVDDSKMAQVKESIRLSLLDEMITLGYIPVLDIDPVWKTTYNVEGQYFSFVMTFQTTFVGKEEAWKSAGVIGGRIIPKSKSETS